MPRPLPPPARRQRDARRREALDALIARAEAARASSVDEALALAREGERQAALAGHALGEGRALLIRSGCHTDRGEYGEAFACGRRALKLFVEGGDAAGQARALNLTGNVFLTTGKHAEAMRLYRRALAVLTRAGLDTSRAHRNIGVVHFHTGHYPEARREYETALSRALAAGERRWAGLVLMDLGNCISAAGNEPAAQNYYRESLAIHEREGHRVEAAYALRNLADSHRRLGHLDEARGALARAIREARAAGEQRLGVYLRLSLAEIDLAAGDAAGAQSHCESALKLARRTGNRSAEAQALAGLGAAAAARRRTAEAARHRAAARAIALEIGDPALLRELDPPPTPPGRARG